MKTTACENFVRKACQSRFFFCEKEFASIEILIQITTVTPPNPSDNSISRRTFIKTSALTVGGAALLARGVALGTEMSNGPGPGCSALVRGTPSGALTHSAVVTWAVYSARLNATCTPPGSPTASKTLTVVGEAWKEGSEAVTTDIVTVGGQIDSNCEFGGYVAPDAIDTYSRLVDHWDEKIYHWTLATQVPEEDLEGWEERYDQWVTENDDWEGIRQQAWISIYMEITDKVTAGDLRSVTAKVYLVKKEKLSRFRGSIENVVQELTTSWSSFKEMTITAEKV